MREFKRRRGYITIAQDSGEIDYLRMAYGLALSLKATQSKVPYLTVLVTPGAKIPTEYADVFDEVIDIPWGDAARHYEWKIHNKWKVYHMSPYEETILLDADMIFPTDVSDWWDTIHHRDVWFTTQPVTYRGDPIVRKAYRESFLVNQLPMAYTAFMFFRQSDRACEYFDTVAAVYHSWRDMREHYRLRKSDPKLLEIMRENNSILRYSWTHFFQDFPNEVSGDLAFAIAAKIMGVEDEFTHRGVFPTFTHMKTQDQGLGLANTHWTDMLPFVLRDDLTLMVGHYRQQYPFHYVEKEWLTEDVMLKLENAANG